MTTFQKDLIKKTCRKTHRELQDCLVDNLKVYYGENAVNKHPLKGPLGKVSRFPLKVHRTPKIFFAKIIRLILWSNLAQKFFDLVKSSNFYDSSKPSFRWFATAQGESGES